MFKTFVGYYKPYIKLFSMDLLCAFFIAAVDLVYPLISKYALNTLLPADAYRAFYTWMVVLVVAYLVKGALQFFVAYKGHMLGVYMETDMRRDLFSHLQKLSFRFYDMLTHNTIDAQIKDICRQCAEKAGGSVTFDDRISCPAVFNDPAVVAAARNAAIAAVGEGNVLPVPQRYSSEDFSHYLTKAPGALVRIGIRNEEIGCGAVCHDAAFKVDDAALKVGCEVLARFALEG